MHDGAISFNKENIKLMECNLPTTNLDIIIPSAPSFRKTLSHESNKVAQLVEEVCQERFELNFQHMFSSSVQDLATYFIKEIEGGKWHASRQ